ncbi:MAG: hypothetical protein GX130_00465 [Candidatus Hydrogenedens sp.]|nr:hypothetical protein [Candidatus Hydrogenedens sp.]
MNLSHKQIAGKIPVSPVVWLALICLFHFSLNIWRLLADNHAISTDEETHMIMARDYYSALFPHEGDRSLGGRLRALKSIRADVGNPVHPPLLHLSGALLIRILGYGIDRLAFTNTLVFMTALIGFYLLVRSFLKQSEALFATAVFSLTPMVYMASRYFMTDFLSMALVIWVIHALWKSEGYTRTKWTLLFGIFNGFALLTRSTAVLYYVFPCCLAAILGLKRVLECSPVFKLRGKAAAKLAGNVLAAAIIGIVLATPWYALHGKQFYQHWMKPQVLHEETPLSILQKTASTPVQKAESKTTTSAQPTAEKKEAAAPAAAEKTAAAENKKTEPETSSATWRFRLHRRIPWMRYPVFVINNAVFLPMFLLSLVGMISLFIHRKYNKRTESWSLFLWLWGSYILLTLLLSFSTPRYALQALPALSLFSAIPFLLLPNKAFRRILQALYLLLLLFQFGTLTVHAFSPLPEIRLPIQPDPEFQAVYEDPGLYVYKSVLHASSAYGRMQAPMKDNFKDRIFLAMLQNEQKQPYSGIEANYARLNMRGMLFEEKHYWMDTERPNPFLRKDIPDHLRPYRYFKHYGWGREINQIIPILPVVDYVVYTTEDISEEKEQEWLAHFKARGFELIERFYEERFGQVSARHYAVVARRERSARPVIQEEDDIRGLSLEELYRFRHSQAWASLTPQLQTQAGEQLTALFQSRGDGMRLNDSVTFLGATVTHEQQDQYHLNLLFKTEAVPTISCRLLVQGVVPPEDMARHFNQAGDQYGQFRWSFEPSPSPSFWPDKGYIMIPFPLQVKKAQYDLSFAFYIPGHGMWGHAAKLGSVDFASLPESHE